MFLHRSNRAEQLAAQLCRLVAIPVDGPLQPECISVQGKGMERWLTLELAKHHGIWGHPDFPFPRTIIDRAFAAVVGPHVHRWDPNALCWATAQILLEMRPEFSVVDHYLKDDQNHRKLLQLARRVADVLDGYAIYRPKLLVRWEREIVESDEESWQAALWLRLSRRGFSHVGSHTETFMANIQTESGPIPNFPKRLSVFGANGLPPFYMQILAALATRIPVHLFHLSPSQEYWADIRNSPKHSEPDDESEFIGHPLLGSMGRTHRDFQFLLERDFNYQDASELYEQANTQDSVLAVLQDDILHLRARSPEQHNRLPLPAPDPNTGHSLTIHSCHGPMREVEVLRDQILAHLQADSTLRAEDIIVMAPDIESYAPFIDAVFSEPVIGQTSLPFHIADRAPLAICTVLDTFDRFLQLITSRLEGAAVWDFLSDRNIHRQFSIELDDLAIIENWIDQSNIRWGQDASHRGECHQPESDLNTWKFGLQRLLLGYAAPSANTEVFCDCLAHDDIEGDDSEILGRFAEFCDRLLSFRQTFSSIHTPLQWNTILQQSLAALVFAEDDNQVEHQILRESFTALSAVDEFEEPVSLAAILPLLRHSWHKSAPRQRFLSGGLRFCQLTPMRSIPHRILCMIGLSEGALPTSRPALSFDLIAKYPKLGDRKSQDDDRSLFLEGCLSARDALILSYVGQSNQTNTQLQPSVLVRELLDTLDSTFETEGLARDKIVVQHPLQAFSPRYFDSSAKQLFSYSDLHCQGARSLGQNPARRQTFLHKAIVDDTSSAEPVIELRDLIRFFSNSAQHFLSQRIGLRLTKDSDILKAREPQELDALERYKIGDWLLQALLDTGDTQQAIVAIQASGMIPLGTPGRVYLQNVLPLVQEIVNRSQAWRNGGPLASLDVDLPIDGSRLIGRLDEIWDMGRQELSYSALAGRRELSAWIQHLVLCHHPREDYPQTTITIGRDGNSASAVQFIAVPDAGPLLSDLLRLYKLGQRSPIPMFVQASKAYAKHRIRAQQTGRETFEEASLQVARNVYWGSPNSKNTGPTPDSEDRYVKQLYGRRDPTRDDFQFIRGEETESFKSIAMTVFAPLLAHRKSL